MEVFWRLVFAHLLGDFTFQTNHVARWKRESEWGMFFHVTHHPVLYLIAAYPFLSLPWVQTPYLTLRGGGAILLIYALHYLEDKWRVWAVGKANAVDNFFYFLWDQGVHVLTLFVFTPKISDALLPPPWLAFCILAAVATHFANIVAYFLEKDFHGSERAVPLLEHKYLFMGERLLTAGCLLLPGVWAALLPLCFLGQWLRRKFGPNQDFTWINLIVGNALAVACGFLARLVLYR